MAIRDMLPVRRRGTMAPGEQGPSFGPAWFWRDVEHMFDDLFQRGFAPAAGDRNGEARGLLPQIDISETEAAYKVVADLPGVAAGDLEVSAADSMLRIVGRPPAREEETRDARMIRVERSSGWFERSMSLPADVDEAQITAHCRDGVLTVTLPKSAKAANATRKIEIQTG